MKKNKSYNLIACLKYILILEHVLNIFSYRVFRMYE